MANRIDLDHGRYWDISWNPIKAKIDGVVKGHYCTKISDACLYCWAEGLNVFIGNHLKYENNPAVSLVLDGHVLDKMKCDTRKDETVVFVCDLTDIGHDKIADEDVFLIFKQIIDTTIYHRNKSGQPKRKFLILTKRPKRLLDLVQEYCRRHISIDNILYLTEATYWGYTACKQSELQRNLGYLADLKAIHPSFKTWLSLEPMIEAIDLSPYLYLSLNESKVINQVVAGFESGSRGRAGHPDWAKALMEQCKHYKTPFFFKSWGNWQPIIKYYHSRFDMNAYLKTNYRQRFMVIESNGSIPVEFKNNKLTSSSVPMERLNPWVMIRTKKRKDFSRTLDGKEYNELIWSNQNGG